MHVIETLLEGSDHLGADVWFREGIADYFAKNAGITSRQEPEAWLASRRSLPGGGNPIAIHLWDDFPEAVTAANAQGSWYAMFEVAVRYLMSESGLGRTYGDVKRLFRAMAGGATPFRDAFEIHMGIPLSRFEDEFSLRIEAFLSGPSGNRSVTTGPSDPVRPDRHGRGRARRSSVSSVRTFGGCVEGGRGTHFAVLRLLTIRTNAPT